MKQAANDDETTDRWDTQSLRSARTWVQVYPECSQDCRTNFKKDRQTNTG